MLNFDFLEKGRKFQENCFSYCILLTDQISLLGCCLYSLRYWAMAYMVRCMKDHIKQSLREKPDHIVLHLGTNDLIFDRPPDLIAKSIVGIASCVKSQRRGAPILQNTVCKFLSKIFN